MSKLSDCWETPTELFTELDKKYGPFDIDLCATEDNSKCEDFCHDYLKDIIGRIESNCIGCFQEETKEGLIKTAFMNPPYSNPRPFIEKAWEDSKYCKIVCLVKCDPSTKWWATFWEYGDDNFNCKHCDKFVCHGVGTNKNPPLGIFCSNCDRCYLYRTKRGPKPGCEVRFFPKRIKFDPPQQLIDSGEVWYLESDCRRGYTKGKCASKCNGTGKYDFITPNGDVVEDFCDKCKGKGYKELSGPTFPCALVIMDRRVV